MPIRIAMHSIIGLQRDKKPLDIPIGVPFDFSDDELEAIEAANPDAVRTLTEAESDTYAATAEAVKGTKAAAKEEGL